MVVKLSPSKIEKFRQYVKEEYNGKITKATVIDSIKGVESWTGAAEFGTAFHLVMENGAKKYFNEAAGKYIIQDDKMPNAVVCEYSEIQLADEFHEAYGHLMTWETWHSETIQVGHHSVKLNMRLDGLLGMEVHENKTTKHGYDPDFYFRSMQWRIYLMCMQVSAVQYNIFPYKEPAPLEAGKTRRKGARDIREVEYHTARFHHGGDTMIREVQFWTLGLIEFCERHQLLPYIEVKS